MSGNDWRQPSVVILLADGLRPDTLTSAIERGDVPALAGLRDEGAQHTVVSTFPSVTGAAYTPFLMGRFPGRVGLPGLRWYDRSCRLGLLSGHSRSYVGPAMRRLDSDLDPAAPTLFELLPGRSLGAHSIITRGLHPEARLGSGPSFIARAGWAHFRGDLEAWLSLDREIGDEIVARVKRDRPPLVFAAFYATDKTSHAAGADSALTTRALRTIDDVVARIRGDAERDGRWPGMHLWVVSDHGHGQVHRHDDLAQRLQASGMRVRAHPWAMYPLSEVAVMVSGNAMAHIYLETWRRNRPFWGTLRGRWNHLTGELFARPSVDLMILPHSATKVEIRSSRRGMGIIERTGQRYSYHPLDGDPLGVGPLVGQCAEATLDATGDGDYPDAIVQIMSLAGAERSGDLILSAAPGWDFRSRHEPVDHQSTHGALHRDHMCVPLLLNRPPARSPLRTVDVMPSVLRALDLRVPEGVDGASFI